MFPHTFLASVFKHLSNPKTWDTPTSFQVVHTPLPFTGINIKLHLERKRKRFPYANENIGVKVEHLSYSTAGSAEAKEAHLDDELEQ